MSGENGGALVRQGFDSMEMESLGDVGSRALAAQMTAAVQARYVMALKRPRSWDDVRVRLLRECDRPRFAEVAIYRKPVGGSEVTGLSIRFAEACVRSMGNLYPEQQVIVDDEDKRIIRVSLTDLESNVTYTRDVTIAKTVERSKVRGGQEVVRERTNSQGRKVFVVRATEDELANKEAAACSKALRNIALRLLPGDIQDECLERLHRTLQGEVQADPAAARKKIADAFWTQNISPAELAEYLGHPLDQCSPGEVTELRTLYQSLRDGEANWHEVLEARTEEREQKRARKLQEEERKANLRATAASVGKREEPAPEPVQQVIDVGQPEVMPDLPDVWRAAKARKLSKAAVEQHVRDRWDATPADLGPDEVRDLLAWVEGGGEG